MQAGDNHNHNHHRLADHYSQHGYQHIGLTQNYGEWPGYFHLHNPGEIVHHIRSKESIHSGV